VNFATERDIRTTASNAGAMSKASMCESWSFERRFAQIFDSSNLLSMTNKTKERQFTKRRWKKPDGERFAQARSRQCS
jgi:hypothetical protein